MDFALNHMAMPSKRWTDLVGTAKGLGCVGIELRNDLGRPLFDGDDPAAVKAAAEQAGLRILALAEVKAFNEFTDTTRQAAQALAQIASSAGAEGIALIPKVGGPVEPAHQRKEALEHALAEIGPILKDHGLLGFVEPLGFVEATLRRKSDAIRAIDAVGMGDVFRLVHDTFHHALAGEDEIFSDRTGIVHISGVTDPAPAMQDLRDPLRVLVDRDDRLGNVAQLRALAASGYGGPVSFEPFAPEIHTLDDPAPALKASMTYLTQAEVEIAA